MTPVNLQKTSRSSSTIFLQVPFSPLIFTIPKLPRPRNDPPCGPCLDNPSGKFSEAPWGVRFGQLFERKRCIKSTWKLDSGFLTKQNFSKILRWFIHVPPEKKKRLTAPKNTMVQVHQSISCAWFFLLQPIKVIFFQKKNIQEGTCLTKAAMKRIQNHHQRFQRFQVSGIIHQLPVSFDDDWENVARKVWWMATKKMGTPFNWTALKVC